MGHASRNTMSLDASTFETIIPSRYITFTLPDRLHIAVLDSPSATTFAATAAMWVPPGRESDWVFSIFSGHLQLLLSIQHLSRSILIGSSPSYPHPTSYNSNFCSSAPITLQENLTPFLSALTPKSAFCNCIEIPEVPFLVYEDEVVKSSILEICRGPRVGEMLVGNVELNYDGVTEFRRRLRFKRMPNFVQSQMRIHSRNDCLQNLDTVEFDLDKGVLVQPYLNPMVAGISVISRFLEGEIHKMSFRPKALCLGVGGGALLGFLSSQLNFEVVGVEEDEVVVEITKKYFSLENDELVHLFVDDGISYLKYLAKNVVSEQTKFHVIMVDLDSSDATLGVCAVLLAMRGVLHEEGVVVINTIPSSKLFYERLICEFDKLFQDLYEIDVGNEENYVVVATKSRVGNFLDANDGVLLNRLRMLASSSYVDSVNRFIDMPCFFHPFSCLIVWSLMNLDRHSVFIQI